MEEKVLVVVATAAAAAVVVVVPVFGYFSFNFSIFVLVESAWDNAFKRTGSSNHEKKHNSSAGQVRSGPVSAPEAGDWWKRVQEGEHRTRRAATLVRPAVVLSVHLPSPGLVIGRDLRSASVGLTAAGDGNS